MPEYEPPTQEEIQRVAQYWERVRLLTCLHDEDMLFDGSEPNVVRCSKCLQPLRMFSEIQIENIRNG
jgi:hypothetical protein